MLLENRVVENRRLIRVGHSPDPDDAFMFHALANDKIATPGYEFQFWFGVLAPNGTPTDVLRVLGAESLKIISQPAFREKFASEGAEFRAGTPETFQSFLVDEAKRWRVEIQGLKLKAD